MNARWTILVALHAGKAAPEVVVLEEAVVVMPEGLIHEYARGILPAVARYGADAGTLAALQAGIGVRFLYFFSQFTIHYRRLTVFKFMTLFRRRLGWQQLVLID